MKILRGPQALLVHCTIKEIEMVIVNAYIPPSCISDRKKDFLDRLIDTWSEFDCPNIICCGDFSTVMEPDIDAMEPDPKSNPINTSHILHSFADESKLVDIYKAFNPISRRVTHFTGAHKTGK